jgi:hypothetical protein
MAESKMRDWMHKNLGKLETLRDEIRVDLHLAGMEAKDKWKELEPKFREAERLAEEASEASRRAMEEMVTHFRQFRESLRRH